MDKKELAAKELRHQYERFCDYYKHCQGIGLDLMFSSKDGIIPFHSSAPPKLEITDRKVY